MGRSVDFLRRAEELELAAQDASHPEYRAELMEIAAHWREIAAAVRLAARAPRDT